MQNHTVILGWTDRTILIVKELCIAQSSEGGSVIAIMDEMEKASGPHACADPRACPACQRAPQAYPAASTGGYVFCYACLSAAVARGGACPVSGLPCRAEDIVRLYVESGAEAAGAGGRGQ